MRCAHGWGEQHAAPAHSAKRGSQLSIVRVGKVSVPGVYAGFIHGFLFGNAFEKGLTFKMGQTHAQRYMPELLEHIGDGKMRLEVIIAHRMKLEDAARGLRADDSAPMDLHESPTTTPDTGRPASNLSRKENRN
jgi:threonine dehydrogenase-like Zn-dependent dehydrogenase